MDELALIEGESARLAARRIRVLAAIHAAELAARAVEVAAGQGPRLGESSVERERHWVSEEVALILRVAGVTAQDRLLACPPDPHSARRFGPTARGRRDASVADPAAERRSHLAHRSTVRRSSIANADPSGHRSGCLDQRLLSVAATGGDADGTQVGRAGARGCAEELRVEVRPLDDGIALLLAWLPAADALRVKDEIDRRAKRLAGTSADPTHDVCRLADVRRAHALIELVDLGAASDPAVMAARPSPAVAVTVSLATLLATNDEPGELAGYGPIPASMAREIASDPTSTWQRLVIRSARTSGRLRPHSLQATRPIWMPSLRARDPVCAFPNCHRRSINCDLDHIQPWNDGGMTTAANLTALCPRHHHAKHDAGWRASRDGATGITRWTSPTRRRYANHPAELPEGQLVSTQTAGTSRRPGRQSVSSADGESHSRPATSWPPARLGTSDGGPASPG